MTTFNGVGCPAEPVTRKVTDIKSADGTQRFKPLPLEEGQETRRYTDRDMHPKVKKAQEDHTKKPWNKRKR